MIKFTRPEVAEKYLPKAEEDRNIIVPGLYKGLLSGVTLSAANRMMRTKTNLLAPHSPKMKTRQNTAEEENEKQH